MKKVSSLILTLILLGSNILYAQKISKDQAKADLKFCYDALKVAHPSVFRYTKENEFNNVYRFLELRIQDSMTVSEFAEIANALVSTTRCVHTSLKNGLKKKNTLVFNMPFVIHQNKLYARGVENSLDTTLYRIMSINKIPAIEIVDRMLLQRAGDGYSQSYSEAYISRNFNVYFNVFYDVPNSCSMVVQKDKVEKEIIVERQKTYTSKYKMYDWEGATVLDTMAGAKFLNVKSIADTRVLRIKSFKKKNVAFYKKIFDEMQRDSVKQLVIDLRNNGGGNIYHAFYLLNNIIDRDLYMYSERRKANLAPYLSNKGKFEWIMGKFLYDVLPNGQRWNGDNGLKYYRYSYKTLNVKKYKPNVVVITDGFTASASSLVASYLKYYYNAEVIGSESGGTYNGNNGRSYPEVMLPNSKIKVRYPIYHINYFPGVPDEGKGVKLDAFISPILDKKSEEIFIHSYLIDNLK